MAFLDFDAELLAPRFRADEQAFALLARGRPPARGRARTAGALLVQTRLPHHEVLEAVLHADPAGCGAGAGPAGASSTARRPAPWPACRVPAPGAGDRAPDGPAWRASGPADGRYLVGRPTRPTLADALAAAPRPAARVRVEVDPPRV